VIVLAHFGHWYVQLIFAAPVLLLGGAMAVDSVRKRRKGREDEDE
jgi:hypothetical protein